MSSDTTTGEVPMKANEPPTSDVATRSPWGGATRPGVADLAPPRSSSRWTSRPLSRSTRSVSERLQDPSDRRSELSGRELFHAHRSSTSLEAGRDASSHMSGRRPAVISVPDARRSVRKKAEKDYGSSL